MKNCRARVSDYSKVVIKTKYAHLTGDSRLPSQFIISDPWMVSNDTWYVTVQHAVENNP